MAPRWDPVRSESAPERPSGTMCRSVRRDPEEGCGRMTTIAGLRDALAGSVLEPSDAGYDDARRVWNGIIDRRPVAIVRAAGVGDIAPTVRTAVELELPLAIRGGGHGVA